MTPKISGAACSNSSKSESSSVQSSISEKPILSKCSYKASCFDDSSSREVMMIGLGIA